MAGTMNDHDLRIVHPPPRPTKPVVPNQVLGTIIFILTEAMLFSGFISAYTISKANVPVWPPVGQPRLPIETTAVTTVVLLLSGALLWYAGRTYKTDPDAARRPMLAAGGLGLLFVLAQGVEWVQLIAAGLTLQTSAHAGFFYLIVGVHALHVVGGLGALLLQVRRHMAGTMNADGFWAARLFWYFVVGLWPVLYWQVYL
jgi:heme/copper-type cytochrome/quinol oxidase subunit 3